LERADTCPSCGTAEHTWREDPYAYEPILHTCRGCQLRELVQDDDTPKPKGTSVRLISKAAAERLALEREQRAEQGTLRPHMTRK
jgi:hypothetical protein